MKRAALALVALAPSVAAAQTFTPTGTFNFSGTTVNLPTAVTIAGTPFATLVQTDVTADLTTTALTPAITAMIAALPTTPPATGTHGLWNDGGILAYQ